jgi:hypothetical protein
MYDLNKKINLKSEISSPGDSESVLSALQNCPSPPTPTEEINNNAVRDAAKAIGARTCQTSTTNVTMGFCSVAILGCAAAQATNTQNLGCETIQIVADKFRQATQNIGCIMNTNVRTIDASIRSNNTVKYHAINGGKINVECPSGFKIEQTSNIKYVDIQTITSEQISEIANEVKTTANQIVKAIQNNEAGYAGTPIGSKFVSDSQTQIDSIDFKQNVKQSVDQMKIRVNSNNEVEFISDGCSLSGQCSEIIIKGNNCEVKNTTLIDIMATKILNDSLLSVFRTKVESDVTKDIESDSKNKSEGVPDVIGDMFKAFGGMAAMGIIAIVIIIIVIIMFIPTILKMLGGEEGKNITSNIADVKTLKK